MNNTLHGRIDHTYFKDKKLYFVKGSQTIMVRVLSSHHDLCIRNGKFEKYKSLSNFIITECSWKKIYLNDVLQDKIYLDSELTCLYFKTYFGDTYYFFCEIGLFGPITKLYHRKEKYMYL